MTIFTVFWLNKCSHDKQRKVISKTFTKNKYRLQTFELYCEILSWIQHKIIDIIFNANK